jgi:hypothetical protein
MSLKTAHIVVALLAAACTAPASAQVFSESAMASGNGLAFLPSPGVGPVAHWRGNYARLDYLGEGLEGMNIFGLEYVLSTNLAGYVRLTGEQLSTLSSLSSYGFGVKALIPVQLPLIHSVGAWFESNISEDRQTSPFFPPNATRGGLTFRIGGNGFKAIVLGGAGSVEGRTFPLAGAGAALALGSHFQIGVEAVRGYSEEQSLHASFDITARVLPHVALIANPGYIRTAAAETMTISFGIAVSTADLDFTPSPLASSRDEFKLPSLDDIMKDPSEEKKQ